MKKLFLLLVLTFAFLSSPLYAQQSNGICGVHGENATEIKERLLKNRVEMANFARQRGAVTYVPVKIHLVAKNDGTGRIAEAKALDMLCILNGEYEPLNIQFYLKDGFSYPDNTLIYTHNGSSNNIWSQAVNFYEANNALNIFITISVNEDSNVKAYFIGSNIDHIYIRQSSVYAEQALAHEMGHFFSLPHTYHGWEGNPWNANIHGNPVGINSPSDDPQIQGVIENEKMDASNCMTAADGICDTGPDYALGWTVSGCANYTGGAMDPNGVLVDPTETNTMAGFTSCDYDFTPDQMDAIHMDLNSSQRNYVNPGTTPNLNEINEVAELISPIEGEVRPFSGVAFEWEAVPGATNYLLEIDRLTSFNFDPKRIIVNTNAAFIDGYFQANKEYYWRVRPFNELSTCTAFSSNGEFSTNNIVSGVDQIEGIGHLSIRPNPVNAKETLYLNIETAIAFEGTVNVYTITGKQVYTLQNQFAKGASTVELSTANLTTGIYLVSVQTDSGVISKRIVVN